MIKHVEAEDAQQSDTILETRIPTPNAMLELREQLPEFVTFVKSDEKTSIVHNTSSIMGVKATMVHSSWLLQ